MTNFNKRIVECTICILIFLSNHCLSQVTFNEILFEKLQAKIESDTKELAKEVERLYQFRCTTALEGCYDGNYHGCVSEMPSPDCINTSHDQNSLCGGVFATTCSTLMDFTTSLVTIPASAADGDFRNPTDPRVIESICTTRALDEWFIRKRSSDKEYWDTNFNGITPSLMYYGSTQGSFRSYPAKPTEDCSISYDPRIRPWYVAASSGPKNIVMVIDKSGSMQGIRIELLKQAAKRVVETLTISDRVAVVAFDTETEEITDNGLLFIATNDNKDMILSAIDNIEVGTQTNFLNAFEAAFDLLDYSAANEVIVSCNTAVLFFTDGKMTSPANVTSSDVVNLVQERNFQTEQKTKHPVFIFTYSVSTEGEDVDSFPSELACSVEHGVFSRIRSDDEIIDSLSSYNQLFSIGLGEEENENFTAWVEPYNFATGGIVGTTVSAPVYDRSKVPAIFLGVVGMDLSLEALNIALGVTDNNDRNAESIRRVTLKSTAVCPSVNLSDCELESYRRQGSAGSMSLCGINCSAWDVMQIEEEKCNAFSDYPKSLWNNTKNENLPFIYRGCCSTNPLLSVDQCFAPVESNILSNNTGKIILSNNTGKNGTGKTVGIVIGVCLPILAVIIIGALLYRRKMHANRKDDFVYPIPLPASNPDFIPTAPTENFSKNGRP